ncbi:hypothetical protein L3Y34_008872 [Caenorhabditis briggsae]|uniref:Uncharacterized protein n=1 Tax=Caenorhabditis briggsae TaxID=6238 RepID=A0AAE9A8P9_CAEBR|nr:hypothetical protein L3Y34_008872 [Caenorhabditis briggsae]
MQNTNSTRTTVPKVSSPDADEILADFQTKKSFKSRETNMKDVVENLWISFISFLVFVTHILQVTIEVYKIAKFCYSKPNHAKELVVTTFRLIKLSYDAEIWTWTDMWEIMRTHLIGPMTRSPGESEKSK